jgi:hypothetical protein
MTPLQQLFSSIFALLPGLIPHLCVVWALSVGIALVSLAIDEYNDELPKRPMLSTALLALRVGIMFSIVAVANEARSKGLLTTDTFGVASIAAFLSGMSFEFTKSFKKKQPAGPTPAGKTAGR